MKREHEALFFTKPGTQKQRLYEALRAIFVDNLSVKLAAHRFSYSPNTLHVLISHFRAGKLSSFFIESKPGPKHQPKRDPVRETAIELRKKNRSIYDISRQLKEQQHREISPRSVWEILRQAGFARLPRRLDEERPDSTRPEPAPKADREALDLSPEQALHTQEAGLFLFLPQILELKLPDHVIHADYLGSKPIPPLQYFLSLLALKLIGRERYSHVMDSCHDPGLALFTGLNAIPKTTALTTYSYRIVPEKNIRFLESLVKRTRELGVIRGESINLDFHSIPHYGEESVLEKLYVPRRGHAEKSVLACLAQDGDTRVFCYSNAILLKKEMAGEVIRFAQFWKRTTGAYPKELVFDSKFTTIEKLNELNKLGIHFITLRRRGEKLVANLLKLPKTAWQRYTLDVPHRKYQTPRVYETPISLTGYTGFLRQLAVMDLGRDKPTLLITNNTQESPELLLTRYAKRMLIENALADAVHFFHLDALCSSLHIQVDFSVLVDVVADVLYHRFAAQLRGFEDATAKQIYRKFVNATGTIMIGHRDIQIIFNRRAHNPLLMMAGYAEKEIKVPWLHNYVLRYRFV